MFGTDGRKAANVGQMNGEEASRSSRGWPLSLSRRGYQLKMDDLFDDPLAVNIARLRERCERSVPRAARHRIDGRSFSAAIHWSRSTSDSCCADAIEAMVGSPQILDGGRPAVRPRLSCHPIRESNYRRPPMTQ